MCNFTDLSANFQPFATGFQTQNVESTGMLSLRSAMHVSPSLNMPLYCSDGVVSFEMDSQCIAGLEQFRMRTLGSFCEEMMKIWRNQIPHIAFTHPYLMHTVLAVVAAYKRCRDMPRHSRRTQTEAYHSYQSALLFNQKLSFPIEPSDRDSLWATATLLGMMAIASFDSDMPEDTWPLRPPTPSDLDWFELNEAKKIIWNLTNPLRLGGIFRAMAHEYAHFHMEIPLVGASGIQEALVEVCNLSDSCTKENNPYFVAAHVLARLQRRSRNESADVRMICFVSQSQASFRSLLRGKDPVALLLLALWYELAGPVLWWVAQRARVESRAIHLYLKQFHQDECKVHQLLPGQIYVRR